MIPEEHKAAVISNGLHFMRAITEAYGAEEGMKLWDSIATTLGPDVKGEIFFAMISGTYNNRIRLDGADKYANKVEVIRAIRSVDSRNLGLKEAKDISDNLFAGAKVVLEVAPSSYAASANVLRKAGLHVT